jgi:FkbM family methyltransferase
MSKLTLRVNHVKHLLYRAFTTKKVLTAYCEKYDLRFRFFIRDGVGRDIYYKRGVYSEDFITSFLLENLDISDDDLIIDIGANIGWYSLTLSHTKRPTIFSFEPEPFNFSLVSQNVELNNRKNVKLFNMALGNEIGTQTLFIYKKYNLGRHSLIQQRNSIDKVEVPIMKLDKLLADEHMDKRPVKLIKIDIEGFEYNAMLGARECLQRCEYLLSEFTPDMMQQINQDPMDYIRLIREAGFTIYQIDEQGLSTPDFEKTIRDKEMLNLFCRRDQR